MYVIKLLFLTSLILLLQQFTMNSMLIVFFFKYVSSTCQHFMNAKSPSGECKIATLGESAHYL